MLLFNQLQTGASLSQEFGRGDDRTQVEGLGWRNSDCWMGEWLAVLFAAGDGCFVGSFGGSGLGQDFFDGFGEELALLFLDSGGAVYLASVNL